MLVNDTITNNFLPPGRTSSLKKKSYSYQEVYKETLDYFNGDDLAASVWVKKYCLTDGEKYFEKTPDDMFKRLAKEYARIEKKYPNPMSENEIYDLMKGFKHIIPQGSPMSAIGNPYQIQSAGNCFVVSPPYDSYAGICQSDSHLAFLFKRRAGAGIDLSNLRPEGAKTNNAAKSSSGLVSFMERFSRTCREVAMSGRRGALMQTIDCRHPQVLDFIQAKTDLNKITGANISVKISNDFMEAVKKNEEFELRWPINAKNPQITKKIKAKEIWDKIIESNWKGSEPGTLFWDTIIENSPADLYAEKDKRFQTISTNPCGEIPLGEDSCRLMLLNLTSFIQNPFTEQAKLDEEKLSQITKKAMRLMDDLVDIEIELIQKIINKIKNDPEPKHIKNTELELWKNYEETAKLGRRTGLGITGMGDAIAMLNMKYGSDESIKITEKIYKTICLNAYKSSCLLAKERGTFPFYDKEIEKNNNFFNKISKYDDELAENHRKYGRRNIALLTTAPAGSVSCLTQTSSGIEPVFMLEYTRRKKINPDDENAKSDFVDETGDHWEHFNVYHKGIEKWMETTGETDITKSPYWNATANEINWMNRVKLQSVATNFLDHSLSSTINVPENISQEEINKIYTKAYETKCKGITIYREGSRSGVLVDTKKIQSKPTFQEHHAPKRPEELECDIHHAKIKGEDWIVVVGLVEDKPYEIFGGEAKFIDIPKKYDKGRLLKHSRKTTRSRYDLQFGFNGDTITLKDIVGQFENPTYGTLTRMVSLSLRHGTPINFVCEQLLKNEAEDIFSFSKCLHRVLKKYIKDGVKASGQTCPSCKKEGGLVYQEGCLSCQCGWSKCG